MQTHSSERTEAPSQSATDRSARQEEGQAGALSVAAAHAETIAARRLRDLITSGPPAARAAALHARIVNSPLVHAQRQILQRLTGRLTPRQAAGQPIHTTGLPSALKRNIEQMSGVSMDG